MAEKKCDECKEMSEIKHLGKINGKLLCKNCRKEIRLRHRAETINESGIEEDLRQLDNKIRATYRMPKKVVLEQKNNYIPKRYRKASLSAPVQESEAPIKIKGSKIATTKKVSSWSLTMEEQRVLLNLFMKRDGQTFEEAKESIYNLKQELIRQKDILRGKKATIKSITKAEMLEDLYKN